MKTKNVIALGVLVAAVLIGVTFITSSSASAAVVAPGAGIVRSADSDSIFAPRPFIAPRPFLAPRPFIGSSFNPFFFPRFNPFFFDDDFFFFGEEEEGFFFEREERDD